MTKAQLEAENRELRLALLSVLAQDSAAVASRFTKEADCPAGGEYGMGYVACAHEVMLRVQENRSAVMDRLAEAGITP